MGAERLGPRGERLAARHLELTGWTILARGYRSGRNEIDLVARRGEVIAFVEVKTRRNLRMGHPAESVGGAKRQAIERAAMRWIAEQRLEGVSYRFDVISLMIGRDRVRLEHLEDAWGI